MEDFDTSSQNRKHDQFYEYKPTLEEYESLGRFQKGIVFVFAVLNNQYNKILSLFGPRS